MIGDWENTNNFPPAPCSLLPCFFPSPQSPVPSPQSPVSILEVSAFSLA
ncbi:hypothetical protein H6F47_16820 [Sphaerospermopsis sp. FACHB-1094]|nr:hypothetical protein [Sphaerospermopsis sp. FACHB-1094]MBD2134048.1 hypothetical protein [Sphaerospermopsis sp. FACHB-1094]